RLSPKIAALLSGLPRCFAGKYFVFPQQKLPRNDREELPEIEGSQPKRSVFGAAFSKKAAACLRFEKSETPGKP
ncbi:MAG: hypothetical protein IJP07_05525, partial [Firmicutes bacterium]|nr:hypothetical protein [Bacillota bacterium]